MANGWHNTGKLRCWAGATGEVDVLADDIIVIALEAITGYDLDDEFVAGTGEGLNRAGVTEVTSTGYTGGFGGAGRLSLASKTLAVDQANNRAEFDCADLTWSSISQATAETWVAFMIAKELTSDALSPLIAFIDTATGIPLTPNGSDITLTINAEGLLQIT